jgi:hypothetical protein
MHNVLLTTATSVFPSISSEISQAFSNAMNKLPVLARIPAPLARADLFGSNLKQVMRQARHFTGSRWPTSRGLLLASAALSS